MLKKEKRMGKKMYDDLMNNEIELKNYLSYIRHREAPSKVVIDNSVLRDRKSIINQYSGSKQYQGQLQVHPSSPNKSNEVCMHVQKYLKTLKEVMVMQSYSSKKIQKKTLQFLEEFPSMNFLYEVINSFGKDQKKLSTNEVQIMSYVTDEMIPLFQKIIERIEQLRKESESKKLMELGHHIQHLTGMVEGSMKHIPNSNSLNLESGEIARVFKKFQADRIEKYLVMEDNILKAQKRFGNFSENFIKNREVFSNLNRVYEDIKKHQK